MTGAPSSRDRCTDEVLARRLAEQGLVTGEVPVVVALVDALPSTGRSNVWAMVLGIEVSLFDHSIENVSEA